MQHSLSKVWFLIFLPHDSCLPCNCSSFRQAFIYMFTFYIHVLRSHILYFPTHSFYTHSYIITLQWMRESICRRTSACRVASRRQGKWSEFVDTVYQVECKAILVTECVGEFLRRDCTPPYSRTHQMIPRCSLYRHKQKKVASPATQHEVKLRGGHVLGWIRGGHFLGSTKGGHFLGSNWRIIHFHCTLKSVSPATPLKWSDFERWCECSLFSWCSQSYWFTGFTQDALLSLTRCSRTFDLDCTYLFTFSQHLMTRDPGTWRSQSLTFADDFPLFVPLTLN